MDETPTRDRAAYMRDYRRRRKLNGHQPLGYVRKPGPETHKACDARIAELERENKELKRLIAEAGF